MSDQPKKMTISSMEQCVKVFKDYVYEPGIKYCNATFDSFLCWSPTPASTKINQSCPDLLYSDPSRLAFRQCDADGLWQGRRPDDINKNGWTNYTPCFSKEMQVLMGQAIDDPDTAHIKFAIALWTRYLEIGGFHVSLLALLASILIFTCFRALLNRRTNIHRNLMAAMTIQVFVWLALYIDQALFRDESNLEYGGFFDRPYVCEASYILLEYAISSMFMWMLNEGIFLQEIVSSAFKSRFSRIIFNIIGWGLPLVYTALWATFTFQHYKKDSKYRCWYGYNFLNEYWLLQGPRLFTILINLMFLLNIMRIVITKLNARENSETSKVKKAVKAALILLPLLGITNVLTMVEPVSGGVWKFAIWSFVTHFLRSFQGFFIALIYCFTNGEVIDVMSRFYRDWQSERQDARIARARVASGTAPLSGSQVDTRVNITNRGIPTIVIADGIQETAFQGEGEGTPRDIENQVATSDNLPGPSKQPYDDENMSAAEFLMFIVEREKQIIQDIKRIYDRPHGTYSTNSRNQLLAHFQLRMRKLIEKFEIANNETQLEGHRLFIWKKHLLFTMETEFGKVEKSLRQLPDDEEYRALQRNISPSSFVWFDIIPSPNYKEFDVQTLV